MPVIIVPPNLPEDAIPAIRDLMNINSMNGIYITIAVLHQCLFTNLRLALIEPKTPLLSNNMDGI
jgi:hypothetical protein